MLHWLGNQDNKKSMCSVYMQIFYNLQLVISTEPEGNGGNSLKKKISAQHSKEASLCN